MEMFKPMLKTLKLRKELKDLFKYSFPFSSFFFSQRQALYEVMPWYYIFTLLFYFYLSLKREKRAISCFWFSFPLLHDLCRFRYALLVQNSALRATNEACVTGLTCIDSGTWESMLTCDWVRGRPTLFKIKQ